MATFQGSDGDDFYLGTEKADYIWLGDGHNQAYTYGGHDNIVAGNGWNNIDAGSGNDAVRTGTGADIVSGGDGDDFIWDGGGDILADQYFRLGAGDDEIVLHNGGTSHVNGGSGDDTFCLFRTGDITETWLGVPDARITEAQGPAGGHDTIVLATGWAGFVMAANVEDLVADNSNAEDDRITWDNKLDNTVLGVEVTGNASNNHMTGSIVRDVLNGANGDDTLDAYYGEGDKLYGGDGNDQLILNFARHAKLYGGAGDDTYVLRSWTTESANSIFEYSKLGEDTIEVRGATIDLNRSNLYAIENVTFSDDIAGATRTVTGNALSNVILTHAGNDMVYGQLGDDELQSGDGNDWLEGNEGSDRLNGGTGNDTVDGGTGNDSIMAGAGDDRLYGQDGDDTMNAGEGVDFAYGGNGNDAIYGFGGTDFVHGEAGNDTLAGDAGNDYAYGGAGNDKIYGGTGNDKLFGGTGTDLLYGGGNSDTFVFQTTADSTAGTLDRVMDFAKGSDRIDLSQIDADATLAGNQTFGFVADRPFFDGAGVVWTRSTMLGDVVEGDVNGDGKTDFAILTTGVWDLQAQDFIL